MFSYFAGKQEILVSFSQGFASCQDGFLALRLLYRIHLESRGFMMQDSQPLFDLFIWSNS